MLVRCGTAGRNPRLARTGRPPYIAADDLGALRMSGLGAYLDSICRRDPAARSRAEVLLYPGVWALGLHRVAHWFYEGGLFFLARATNHLARALTAIDIHPGARIGRNFFIDHGFTVIGETAVIGDDVTIYQCVTLGGTNPADGVAGKRHPTIGDGAIIGSGAQVLGPILVGAGARVGANAVVTRDVEPGAVMVGIPARPVGAEAVAPVEARRTGFDAYGIPCRERFDASAQPAELARCELEAMRARLDHLIATLPASPEPRD